MKESFEKLPARVLTSIKAIPINNVEEVFFYDNDGNNNNLKFNPADLMLLYSKAKHYIEYLIPF